ncbi:hypothetical protein [uncultured Sulfitobacter sp.]|uniref:hypothetical protein n=1 Tax=uncultured Sulfitobacter sp. TaxID=191468 RepID=UPI00260C6C98|nr:hypothetical protein [uncultured Sulfitobacter sp.]
MMQQVVRYLRGYLVIALAVGLVLSANSRLVAHDFSELAKIVADHHDEITEHGHAHEDIVDVMHAYLAHSHEIADHDHNIAFLPPRDAMSETIPSSTIAALSDSGMRGRRDYGLDRPPRV